MGDVIDYRGPDGLGLYHDQDIAIGLGNQRLAILDLENGQQPFYSDDKSIVVVQNGEIFNHLEIAEELKAQGIKTTTNCDTEVILRLYEKDGINAISKLNGMFAIAIFDKRISKLYVVRDRVGEKPLYYSFNNNQFLFGSEIKSILKVKKEKELEFKALEQYLSFNYVPPPLTMFKDICHMKPGTYIEVSNDGIAEHRWWDLVDNTDELELTEEQWIERFNSIMDDAVRIRLRSDVPFGAFLSGGVDSSSVVGYMSKHLKNPVNTYCIGFDNPLYDESKYAEEASKRFKTNHNVKFVDPNMLSLWEKVLYHTDQPHGDVSFMPTYKVAEMASEHVKMVLTGDGADELFAGYDKYKAFFGKVENTQLSESNFRASYCRNISLFQKEEREKLFAKKYKDKLSKSDVILELTAPLFEETEQWDRINQVLYIDTMLLLSGNNLVKPDRMGMAVSIENRAPFLDYRIIELAFSMPGNLKLRDGETKYIYKKAVSDLIGTNLAYRKKQMFTVPIGDWFKTSLYPLCEDLLLSEQTRERELFDYGYIEQMLKEHCNDKGNYTREIRALMAFEYWCRIFLDN